MISCRLDKYFDNASEFKPERWLKKDGVKPNINPYLVLPFGHGMRSCIARRFAEQNILIFLIRVGVKISNAWSEFSLIFVFSVDKELWDNVGRKHPTTGRPNHIDQSTRSAYSTTVQTKIHLKCQKVRLWITGQALIISIFENSRGIYLQLSINIFFYKKVQRIHIDLSSV